MFNLKIDTKTIIIFALAIGLVMSFIFRPSKPIDKYEDEIKLLKEKNIQLIRNNDSIKNLNKNLTIKIDSLNVAIDTTQSKIKGLNDKIQDLENEKSKVSDYVDGLDADGVAKSLTEYLRRR